MNLLLPLQRFNDRIMVALLGEAELENLPPEGTAGTSLLDLALQPQKQLKLHLQKLERLTPLGRSAKQLIQHHQHRYFWYSLRPGRTCLFITQLWETLMRLIEQPLPGPVIVLPEVSGRRLPAIPEKILPNLPGILKQAGRSGCPAAVLQLLKGRLGHFSGAGDMLIPHPGIRYTLRLAETLATLPRHLLPDQFFTPADECLISLNYNSRAYSEFLSRRIMTAVKRQQGLEKQLLCLALLRKVVQQIPKKKGYALLPMEISLSQRLENWFAGENDFMLQELHLVAECRKKYHALSVHGAERSEAALRCSLPAAQLALLLRAMQETRLLKANSRSQVFHTLIPLLSSLNQQSLSAASIRSKSYRAARSDKRRIVETLESLISTIRLY